MIDAVNVTVAPTATGFTSATSATRRRLGVHGLGQRQRHRAAMGRVALVGRDDRVVSDRQPGNTQHCGVTRHRCGADRGRALGEGHGPRDRSRRVRRDRRSEHDRISDGGRGRVGHHVRGCPDDRCRIHDLGHHIRARPVEPGAARVHHADSMVIDAQRRDRQRRRAGRERRLSEHRRAVRRTRPSPMARHHRWRSRWR